MMKKSIAVKGHRTSIALEPVFWHVLERCAKREKRSLPDLIAQIDNTRTMQRPPPGLASALRIFALLEVAKATPDWQEALQPFADDQHDDGPNADNTM